MKYFHLTLLLSFFILNACTPVQTPTEISGEEVAMTEKAPAGSYIYGDWIRTAVYADGLLMNTTLKMASQ